MNKKITFLFLSLLMCAFSWQGMAQTGSTCEDPMVVSSVPFTVTGNTSDYGDNYSSSDIPPVAPGAVTNGTSYTFYLNGDEAVYSYTAGADGAITIGASGVVGYTGIFVFTGCPFSSTVGYHVSSTAGTRSIPDLPVVLGETYYIVISTWASPQSTPYTLTIDGTPVLVLEPCTGAEAGTVVGDTSRMVCPNSPFSLSVTGNSNPAEGLIRTWQSSPAGANTWTSLDSPSSTLNVTGISEPMDYRYHVECDNGDSDDSEVISITLNPNTMECYCIPASTNANYYINDFSTTGGVQNISNLGSGYSTGGYGDFTAMTVEGNPGDVISFIANLATGNTYGFRIWVDWNQDGSFSTTEEVAYSSAGYLTNHTGTFTIPTNAIPGDTRMRIVNSYIGSTGDVNPCNTAYTYGEFEDYTVSVIAPDGCTGTPVAGTAIVNPASGNGGTSYTVSAEGTSVASGLSFQWQSNTNGAGWVDEGTATEFNTPFTATAPTELGDVVEWRLALTCTASGETSYSEIATFTTTLTYCTATSSTVEAISRVVFAGIDNVSPATSTLGYEDFTAIVGEVEGGETYSFAAEGNTAGSFTNYFTVWIDWNHNGEFEASEMYEIGSINNSNGTDGQQATADIAVPADAVAGETRMRVRKNFNSSLTNPCGSNSYGQTEDYTVNVGGGGGTFPSPYCNINEDDGEVMVEEISKVELAGTTITNDNTTDVLIDKTDVVVTLATNGTYTLSVEGNTYGDFQTNIVAFIDWNQNGILDDTGEVYELGTLENSTGNDGTSVSMDISVPADAILGETRIRITKTYFDDLSDPIVTPCGIQFDPFGMGTESGYGQALDFTLNIEEGANNEDCDQGDDSNNFENGLNVTGGGIYRNADDFMVSADNTLNIRSIELNLITTQPIITIDFNFYNDDNGAPGTVVQTVTGLVPYAQTAIGSAFGTYTVYTVLVETDLDFVGGDSGTTFWMEPVAQSSEQVYWEVSTLGTLGAPIHSSESGGDWIEDAEGYQGVFKLHCDVADPPPFQCLFDITASVEPITRLVMANVDNSSPATSTIALEDFTDVLINVEAGQAVDVALEGNTDGPFTNYFTIFINTGGEDEWSTFEMYEIGSITSSTGTDGQQATGTIVIPTSLTEGQYLMRVVKNYNTSPTDPCAAYSFGQGEDYTLVVGELEDCSGTPDGGVATVSPASGNPNSAYTVSASGFSFGNGLTYQWQSNTDGAGWVDEGTATAQYSSFAATAPATSGVVVEWRLEVTCTLSSETSYSETATFTTTEPSGYCTPNLDCTDGDMITNVTFQEINNTTTCSANGYGDFTAMAATVQSGGTYQISVSVGGGWPSESVSVWIDFDNSGSFDENEFFYIGTGSAEALMGDIAIPSGTGDGNYTMRVRVAAVGETSATWDMACDETQGFGETEDYTVTVDGSVGIADNSNLNFSYHPNPMADVLYISASKTIESITAYNVLGQQVLSNREYVDGKVDVSSLPTGTFIFRVTFEGGLEENFKVLKK